jgi:hypothetical protein
VTTLPTPASVVPPIAGAGTWSAVMTAAGHRCQCTGQCGATHRKGEGRCEGVHGGYAGKNHPPLRLIAAPADPTVSELAAAALPPADLVAWCPPCHTGARRTVRPSRNTPPQEDSLW